MFSLDTNTKAVIISISLIIFIVFIAFMVSKFLLPGNDFNNEKEEIIITQENLNNKIIQQEKEFLKKAYEIKNSDYIISISNNILKWQRIK